MHCMHYTAFREKTVLLKIQTKLGNRFHLGGGGRRKFIHYLVVPSYSFSISCKNLLVKIRNLINYMALLCGMFKMHCTIVHVVYTAITIYEFDLIKIHSAIQIEHNETKIYNNKSKHFNKIFSENQNLLLCISIGLCLLQTACIIFINTTHARCELIQL